MSADFDTQAVLGKVFDRLNNQDKQLTRIETHLEGLVGNGQPGAITKIEARLLTLEEFKWKLVGGFLLVVAMLGVAEAWIHH